MGDGKVALILDILGLAQHASRWPESLASMRRPLRRRRPRKPPEQRESWLLFRVGDARKNGGSAFHGVAAGGV